MSTSSNPVPEGLDTSAEANKVQEELPPMSDRDFKIYNRLAEKMDYFHEHFRRSWTLLWTACTTGRRPQNMTLKQFLSQGIDFANHLTAHHGIEETYVFPALAKNMPEFRGNRAELLRQHRDIHKGLDDFAEYLQRCRSGETDFEMDVLKSKMETWGDVLWTHLDQEVETLGAQNMRKYWTKDEIMRLPM